MHFRVIFYPFTMPEPPGELMTREKNERMTSDVTNLWACDKWNLYLFENFMVEK